MGVDVIWVQVKAQEVQSIFCFLKHQEWYNLQKGVNSPGGGHSDESPRYRVTPIFANYVCYTCG